MANKFIDLEKIFHAKNPRLAGLLPNFALNYIRKIIHEDDVNAFIAAHGHKKGFDFVNAIIDDFKINIVTTGIENIPAEGGFIMATNHPLGGLDGIAMLHVISQKRKDVKFIVNDILLQLKNLEDLFIGVNKHGKNAQHNIKTIDELYASGKGVLIFPAGLVSRRQKGTIKDLEWKKSFISKAKKYQRIVIPAHIGGFNSRRFYNIANLRKHLGIKANIEMFFLVDEMYKHYHKTIPINIGKPILHSHFDKARTDLQWAQWVKEKVYNLQ